MERLHVAGLPVTRADVTEVLDALWRDANAHEPRVYALVNGHSATLRRVAGYLDALEAPLTAPLVDGAPVALGVWLTGQGRTARCPGPDLLEAAAARASRDGASFYLLGGAPGVAEALGDCLTTRHPGLRIAGTATPSFDDWSDAESACMADAAAASGASIVWLGVSAPKQEIWAASWAQRVGRPVVCVGAAFDFLSGRKPRAPSWMRAAGLEWLFRLLSEPRRVWKRYLVGNAVFLWDLLRFGRRSRR